MQMEQRRVEREPLFREPETELWAREDWQKVNSSLSHDAFIRRSSSLPAPRSLSLSRARRTGRLPEHPLDLAFSLLSPTRRDQSPPPPALWHCRCFARCRLLSPSCTFRVRASRAACAACFMSTFIAASGKGTESRAKEGQRIGDENFAKEVTPLRRLDDLSEHSSDR